MPVTLKNSKWEPARSSIRVLVVDDFYPLANAFVDLLATNFYDARAAHTAAEALNIADEFRPHALISDVTLPDMDGLRLAAEFEKRYPDCNVLLMSAAYIRSQTLNGFAVVQKDAVVEGAFRLLDTCRRSKEVQASLAREIRKAAAFQADYLRSERSFYPRRKR